MPKKKFKRNMNQKSRVIPVRVSLDQLIALEKLPEGVSLSALARALFAKYLEGSLGPDFVTELYDEVARTGIAIKSRQQSFARSRKEAAKADDGAKGEPLLTLRERILLDFNKQQQPAPSGPESRA